MPTHSSNLDSLLIGYAIYRMGLPPFVYGAGLNLFTNPLTSFFMHNLGAYTVDRSKSDPLYRETLKEYATVSLELGQHNLFFPGGTRSRSGEIESKIKLGLLGTGLAAYRNNLLRGAEAASADLHRPVHHLVSARPRGARRSCATSSRRPASREYIVVDDEFSRIHRWVDFLRGLARARSPRSRPHRHARSIRSATTSTPRGSRATRAVVPIDPKRYLYRDGRVVDDPARDAEYTRVLGERIVASYRRDNVALPTNVLAFALLELLRRDLAQPDLFRMLRTIGPDTGLDVDARRGRGREAARRSSVSSSTTGRSVSATSFARPTGATSWRAGSAASAPTTRRRSSFGAARSSSCTTPTSSSITATGSRATACSARRASTPRRGRHDVDRRARRRQLGHDARGPDRVERARGPPVDAAARAARRDQRATHQRGRGARAPPSGQRVGDERPR